MTGHPFSRRAALRMVFSAAILSSLTLPLADATAQGANAADLARIESYLNSIRTVQSRFLQVEIGRAHV